MSDTIHSKVGQRTLKLISKLETGDSESRRVISYLRRSNGALEDSPNIWNFIYRGEDINDTLPDHAYQSVLSALKLYSIHKRSNSTPHRFKKDGGITLPEFLAKYRMTTGGHNIDSKISAILISQDADRTVALVESLFERSAKSISSSIDYVNLAQQFYSLRFPVSHKKIMLDWGKKYYQSSSETPKKKEVK